MREPPQRPVDAATFVKRVRPPQTAAVVAETLRAFGEDRAARVLEVRPDCGELVLELITPGATLAATADEDGALRVVVDLLTRGWPKPAVPTALPPLRHFARALDTSGPASARAAALLTELLDDKAPAVVLHGDLHYGNVLSSHRASYLLIDPKGAIGDPAFDVGYFVSRPGPSATDRLPVARAIEKRLSTLPRALGLDRRRVAAYAYVAAVLSMAWAIEDGDHAAEHAFAEVARILDSSQELDRIHA